MSFDGFAVKSSIFGGIPGERTVLIRLKNRTLFYSAWTVVLFGWGAVLLGFGEPGGWIPEMLGPVGRPIFAAILAAMAFMGLLALVGGLVTRLEFVVVYGGHTLYMPESAFSRAYWVPWRREEAMVPIDLRNATLETETEHLGFGIGAVEIVISSGDNRVESSFSVSFLDEEDMWRRWGEFQASLHGVDIDSLPPNALRPDESADQVAVKKEMLKERKFWVRFMVGSLVLSVVGILWLFVFVDPL